MRSYELHGFTAFNKRDPKEYSSWKSIKRRCFDTKFKSYKNYGGRGIKICERWENSFLNFITDMGMMPHPSCSIDRIDNDGNYEPNNCRWATRIKQANNKSNNVFLEWNGEKKTVAEWSRSTNIPIVAIRERLKKWSIEKTLSTPLKSNNKIIKKIKFGNKSLSMYEWEKVLSIDRSTIYRKLQKSRINFEKWVIGLDEYKNLL